LTDPEKILRWMGAGAPGRRRRRIRAGSISSTALAAAPRAARSARSRRSIASPAAFGWDENEAVPSGSSLVEIDLIDRDGGTARRAIRQ